MSGVYSKRLLSVAGTTTSVAAVVPGGRVWVVKDITAYSGTEGVGDLVGVTLSGGIPIFGYTQIKASAFEVGRWTGMQVLGAGEALTILPVSGKWWVSVSGYDFSA